MTKGDFEWGVCDFCKRRVRVSLATGRALSHSLPRDIPPYIKDGRGCYGVGKRAEIGGDDAST